MHKRMLAALACCLTVSASAFAQVAPDSARAGVERFNRAFADATRRMDNAASLALWEDDGVSLLPGTKPIVGRRAIGEFMTSVTSQFPGAHMRSFESECFDITISGDWASEWCTEHQVVDLPDGRPPFDGRGKMLLVLHRGADGAWRLSREMWNQA
jgi:ketosteroid isomerase-like protein